MKLTGTINEFQKKLEFVKKFDNRVESYQKLFLRNNHFFSLFDFNPLKDNPYFQRIFNAFIKLAGYFKSIISYWSSISTSYLITIQQDDTSSNGSIINDSESSQKAENIQNGQSVKVEKLENGDEPTDFLEQKFSDSELVIGLIGAVGTELNKVITELTNRLTTFNYTAKEIRVSNDVIAQLVTVEMDAPGEFNRIDCMMTAGNRARELSGDNSILALGAAAKINEDRPLDDDTKEPFKRRNAYIISSLKHPDEVTRLREIYKEGFYLIGVHSDENRRKNFLKQDKGIDDDSLINKLNIRDADEQLPYGQRTSDTFHLSDVFIQLDENYDKMKKSIWRVLDIIFGHPYRTPTFDEYAMFLAFTASLRSADLSRQIGAVIAKEKEILATGANDCPRFGGGLYWPKYDSGNSDIIDEPDGRDYMRGNDSNKIEKEKIIENIVENLEETGVDQETIRSALNKTAIKDITEYGRVVHAEMEAILSCSRKNISSKGATLYCTTFPCHNCAKHIIASGIKRVVYVEPYPKSKAAKLYNDCISLGFSADTSSVHFEPFVGVGPRRFFDLFSMHLGSGYPLKRKDRTGHIIDRAPQNAKLRIQMLPCSYIEIETIATSKFNKYRKEINFDGDG